MKDRTVTRPQFAAAIFAALLSPLMRMLPRTSVETAGKGAWLSVVPAFLLLLVLTGLMNVLRRQTRPGEGMADVILRFFGPVFGRAMLALYGAWFLFYAGFILRSGAARLTATVYQHSGVDPFILVMLVLCLIASLGTLRATARCAVLLRAVLLIALALVSVFAVSNLSMKNLFPLTLSDAPSIVLGAWPIVTVGGVAALFSFLNAYIEPTERPTRWTLPPLAVFLAAAGLLCFVCVGTFGAGLTTRLSYPFFTMTRDVSLVQTSQRIEAVVIALWVFADFLLCTMLLRCANEALRTIFRLPKPEDASSFFSFHRGRWLLWLEAPAVYACSHLVAASSSRFFLWSQTLVPLIMNSFVFGGFALIWLVGKLRKKFE